MQLDLDKLSTARGALSIPGGRLEVSRLEVGKAQLSQPEGGGLEYALSGLGLAAQVRLGDSRLRVGLERAQGRLRLEPERLVLTGLSLPQLSVTDLTLALGSLRGTSPAVQLSGSQGECSVGLPDRRVAVDRLSVSQATVRRPALVLELGGQRFQLQQDEASTLSDLELVGLTLPGAGQARASLGRLASPGLALVEAERSVHLDLTVTGASVAIDADGRAAVELGRVELANTGLEWGTVGVVLAKATCEGFTAQHTAEGDLALATAGLSLSGLELTLGPTTLRLGQVRLPRGVTLSGRELRIAELLFEQATLEVDPLELRGAGGDLDLPFLDALNGRLHADITLDVTAPVLGRRRATHPVRLAVESGTIDFKKLEGDLALLENSVLDFEVHGDTLILEKDLPLVPFDNTTLVSWHLPTAEERDLARRNRVRLRRLLDYRMAEDDQHAIEVELHRLVLSDIDLSLNLEGLAVIALGAVGEIHLGGDDRPGVLELSASGTLCHDAAGPAETTELSLSLREINGRLPTFSVGGLTVKTGAFRLGEVEKASVTFAGFVPRRIGLTVGQGAIRDLSLTWPERRG